MTNDWSLGRNIHHLSLSYTDYDATFPREVGFNALTPKALYERQQSHFEQWVADAYLVTRVAANVRSLSIDFGDTPEGCEGAKLLRAIRECCRNLRILRVRNASPLASNVSSSTYLKTAAEVCPGWTRPNTSQHDKSSALHFDHRLWRRLAQDVIAAQRQRRTISLQ